MATTTADKRYALVLRIDKADHRRTCNCDSYSVEHRDGRNIISLFEGAQGPDGRPAAGLVSLEPDERCYVMDANTGLTVEIVYGDRAPRSSSRQAQMRTTGDGK